MSESPIKFGTDGWRAIIAEDFTFANVRACAAAVARYLRRHGLDQRPFVIGYDTRFASEDFAAAVAEVLAGAGIRTLLADRPCPTPVVSFAILERGAGGAVVITASHNPWRYNGFKYKPEYAGSASPEIIAEIEGDLPEALAGPPPGRVALSEAERTGVVARFDPRPTYLARLSELVDLDSLRAAGLRVAVDAMYGAGAGYFPELLSGGATEVAEIHGERNPLFPGIASPEPIARNLEELCAMVPREGFHAGVANDGDADRVGLVDERGRFINQLQVFALLTYYLLEYRGERGPIVKSVTTTQMVQRLGEQYGVPVYETQVGFKYLGPKMLQVDALIGGEESGGYGFRGHIPERDGVLAGLYLLDFMARTGKRPSELLDELYERVGPHFYDRVDIHLSEAERPQVLARAQAARPDAIAGLPVTSVDTTDGFRFVLDGRGWLLLRFSGTEPLLRIYTEVDDEALVPRILEGGRELAGA